MTLIIIDAADVRDGEPRWWYATAARARIVLSSVSGSDRTPDGFDTAHRDPKWSCAIVDRPVAAPPPPQSPAPVDIKAARAWAEQILREMSDEEDDADLWPIARVILACTPPDLAAAIAALPVVGDEGRGGDLPGAEFEALAADVTGWCQAGDRYRVDPDEYNTIEWLDTDGSEPTTFAECHADEGAPFLAHLLNVAPRLIAELRRWREDCGDGVDALIAKWAGERPTRDICAHCREEFPLDEHGQMPHVRECERNPMVVELRNLERRIDDLRGVADYLHAGNENLYRLLTAEQIAASTIVDRETFDKSQTLWRSVIDGKVVSKPRAALTGGDKDKS